MEDKTKISETNLIMCVMGLRNKAEKLDNMIDKVNTLDINTIVNIEELINACSTTIQVITNIISNEIKEE